MSVLINNTELSSAVRDILDEHERSIQIHGPFPKEETRRALIMLEEGCEAMAEVAKAALEISRFDKVSLGAMTKEETDRRIVEVLWDRQHKLRKELIHAGAMVIKSLIAVQEDIDRTRRRAAASQAGRID